VKSGGMQRLADAHRLMLMGNTLRYKRYLDDYPVVELDNIWNDTAISGFARKKQYVVETSPKVVERCILMTSDPGDLVLDATCGSGTTAYAAERFGRRWITCDTSRVSLTLAKQRLLTATYEYYQLAQPSEGVDSGFNTAKSHISNWVPLPTTNRLHRRRCITTPCQMLRRSVLLVHSRWKQFPLLWYSPLGT